MLLKSIRLAGFKSFADPTTIRLDPEISAVVGPNGCGKSNIVDGLRWAIGERSASVLRGSTFDDIIFDGSDLRSPSSHASVELLFDNSDAKLGGEYASYAEISVRREIAIDQPSEFFLNGSRCRSRDIQDLFLGTGFGTKGYAIIEQGMTDRLVRSKPEELRHYLEEAAGVTNYRERRHQTELLIHRTEENILRIEDDLERLSTDLRHLKRQAREAERFQKLNTALDQLRIKKIALQIKLTSDHLKDVDKSIEQKRNEQSGLETEAQLLDNHLLELRNRRDSAVEQERQRQDTVSAFNQKISAKENLISVHENQIRTITENLKRTEGQKEDYLSEIRSNEAKIAEWEPKQRTLTRQVEVLKAEREQKERDYSAKSTQLNELRTQSSETVATINQISERRVQYAHERSTAQLAVSNAKKRLEELHTERNSLVIDDDELKQASEASNNARLNKERIESSVERLEDERTGIQSQLSSVRQRIHSIESDLGIQNNRLSNLRAEQRAAMGLSIETPALNQWLSSRKINENRRLISQIKVQPGWETAVEIVLGSFTRAIEIQQIDELKGSSGELLESGAVFVTRRQQGQTARATSLLDKVLEGTELVADLLLQVRVADTFSDALTMLESLRDDQSVVTADGVWLSNSWVRFTESNVQSLKMLTRVGEIESVEKNREELLRRIEREQQTYDQLAAEQEELLNSRETLQLELVQASENVAITAAEEDAKSLALSEVKRRVEEIHSEISQIETNLAQASSQYASADNLWSESDSQLATVHVKLSDLENSQRVAEIKQEESRESLKVLNEQFLSNSADLERITTEIRSTKESTSRQITRLEGLDQTIVQQTRELEKHQSEIPVLRKARSDDLSSQSDSRQLLTEQSEVVRTLLTEILAQESTKSDNEDQTKKVESAINTLLIDRASTSSALEFATKNLDSFQISTEDALALLSSEDLDENIDAEIERREKGLARLGDINHQAIEEHARKLEEKTNTDRQLRDVEQSLTNLRSSVQRIDKEIQSKVKGTFDTLNEKLDQVFPRLFGGGKAVLEMTGENLLEAGVVIRVKPPGKANLPINLLSGGEKALAALSFVFAVFLLNPSPVCILDEVDAPLDQQNVERFADLLSELVNTQFILITHNPLTMERTKNLLGVTMQEPGVSRVVSVSLETAIGFAQGA